MKLLGRDSLPGTLLYQGSKGREPALARRFRVAYVVSHPIQYQAPMLRRIAAEPDIDLTVFFLSDLSVRGYKDPGFGVEVKWDVPLLDGYRYAFLGTWGKSRSLTFWRPWGRGLEASLARGHFDAVWVHGYSHQAMLRAVAWARMLGAKTLLRGESHLKSGASSGVRRWLKDRLLRQLFRRIDAFLAIGTLNRQYYQHYGVSDDRIFLMPYAVDNQFFQDHCSRSRAKREDFRAELGLEPGRPVILFASKLQRRKRPRDLLEAYVQLSPDRRSEPRPYLLFVGDGQERSLLEARVRQLGWSSVRFLGFRNQTELPRFYDLCNIFVLPSEREPWGLVVNEVMNAAKPVIVSDQVGAGPDLVRNGENGFVVPVGDIKGLAERLALLVEKPELCEVMGARSRRIISDWSFDRDVEGLRLALEATLSRGHRP